MANTMVSRGLRVATVICLVALVTAIGCSAGDDPPATATTSLPAPTFTPQPTYTPPPTYTPQPTPLPTATPYPTAVPATSTPEPTWTPHGGVPAPTGALPPDIEAKLASISGECYGDRDALTALFWATGGDGWLRSDYWVSDLPVVAWYGVETDPDGCVTGLGLWDNGLNGEIPRELGRMPRLEFLALSNNELRGEIPPELGNLSNLYWLHLENNQLSGDVPQELGRLAGLAILNIGGNRLGGCVPATLRHQLDATGSNMGGLPFCQRQVAVTPVPAPTAIRVRAGDYDADSDGLIEVSNLAQLDAIRYDLDGDGSSNSPLYAVAFPGALPDMGCDASWCSGYELVRDLDLDTNRNGVADKGDAYWNGGRGWLPIGDNRQGGFTAVFRGNGHTVANLYIRRSSQSVGLFGLVRYEGIVDGVGVVSAYVAGYDSNVGALAGLSEGQIINSYATGTVAGWGQNVGGLAGANAGLILGSHADVDVSSRNGTYTGGLVGQNTPDAVISASYAVGDVASAGNSVGGLVGGGNGDSLIIASYATGKVTGKADVGGLVGYNFNAVVAISYATGPVLTLQWREPTGGGLVGRNSEHGWVGDSYWTPETTRRSNSSGGESKSKEELQSPTGYDGIYANWNMDVDGDGNADDPWDFGTSRQYPVLKYGVLIPVAQR